MTDEQWHESVERRLEALMKAVEKLAMVEERLAQNIQMERKTGEDLRALQGRVQAIEVEGARRGAKMGESEWGVRMLIAAIVGASVYLVTGR